VITSLIELVLALLCLSAAGMIVIHLIDAHRGGNRHGDR
jgi:hypothetical protein